MIKRFKVRRKDASSGTVSKIRRAAFALVEGMEPRLLFSGTHQSEAIAPFDGPVWHGNSVDLVATPASQIGNLVQKVVTNSSSYGGGGTITVSTAVVGHVAPNAPTGTASVRLSDGTLTDAITDLQSNGFGTLWGVTRSWTNNPGYPDNGQVGNNWMISQEPELFLSTESLGGPVIVITSGASAQWFTSNGNTTSPTFTSESWSHNTLTYTGSSFVLTDGGGNQTTFYGVSGVPAVQEGAFKSYQGVSGQEITANYNSAGVLTSETRSQNVNGQLLTESFVYSYYSSGYNVGEISSIQLEESVNGGTPMVTEQALYDYYNGQYTQSGEAFGNLNDLRSVQIENGQGVLLSEDYYRYYVPSDATASGPVGMLQYEVIGPDFSNFQASSLAAGTTAFTAPNSALQPFADLYLQYGSQTTVIGNSALGTATYTFKQVTEEVVANSGSSTATGNTQQTYRFSYQTYSVFSPNSSPNNWYYKTTETFPDLSTELVYCNEYGEALLTATTANGSQTATYSYNHFDPNGQVLYSADAAAVVGYTVSGAALNVNLAAHSGLIDITNYYGDSVQMGLPVPFLNISAASSTAAGSATGYVADHQVELGSDGTPILLNATDYIARSAGAAAYAATVYLVANDIIYANGSGSSGKTTAYSYSNWNGFEPQQVAETFTPFTNAQNGVSTSSTLEFDVDGNEIYYQAPGSNSGVSQSYDIATGAELAPVDISLPDETAYSAPISSADNYLLVENQTLGINATNGVLANDFDPDPTKTLSAILLSEPSNGSLTLNPDGSFSYVPAANFTGTDSFQYLATDGNQHSDMTTVTLTVASTTAENIVVQQENTEITLDGLVSETGSSVSFTQPSDGTVGYVSGSNNQIYYLPDSGFSGTDSFSYIASDGRGDVADETVSITILPDGDSNVSDSTPPGTKTFTINDSNFSVNPLNAFTPTASGNYHFSAVTSNTTTPTTWYDSHGQPGTITTTTTQTLDVTSSG